MKIKVIKIAAVAAMLATSAVAYASVPDCCSGLECCLRMLACCF